MRPVKGEKVDASSTFQSTLLLLRRCRRPARFILRRALRRGGGWQRLTAAGTNHSAAAYRGGEGETRTRLQLWHTKTKSKYILAAKEDIVRGFKEYCYVSEEDIFPPFHSVWIFIFVLRHPSDTPLLSPALRWPSLSAQAQKLNFKGKLLQPLKSKLQILWFSSNIFTLPPTGCMSLQTWDMT